MRGLRAEGSFVGNGKIVIKGDNRREVLIGIFIAFIFLSILVVGVMGILMHGSFGKNMLNPWGYRAANINLGDGYKQPTVCYSGYFVVAYYNSSGYLNVTSINTTTGEQVSGPYTVSTDVDKYRRTAIAYDGENILVIWRSGSNKSLYGRFLNNDGSPNSGEFRINNSNTNVGSTDFDVIGILNYGLFVVVWSDAGYNNHYRIIHDTNPMKMGSVGSLSSDTKSHARNQIAYDPSTGNVMVVWRRYNSSGIYNISGRIFSVDSENLTLNPITNDFTIGNGVSNNTKYDYPSIASGGGYFFVAFTDYNSPYGIYGRVVNASNGLMGSIFQIGSTGYSGRGYLGISFNGTNFIVTWTNENYDILARNYDTSGNPTTKIQTIAGSSHREETPDVAVDTKNGMYYFVWYDYTSSQDYGSLWNKSGPIPELGVFLPIVVIGVASLVIVKKRRIF